MTLLLAVALSVAVPAADPINRVAQDASWLAAHGAPPPSDASEHARIVTHLSWIEARLREKPLDHLTPSQRAARERSLEDLRAYQLAGVFPQWHGEVVGRAPRWVDDEGRHCAVAAMVTASGDAALVERVRRAHEADYVEHMRVPELAAWAREHGFELEELALIQPTYGDGRDVSPERDRARAEEQRRRARIPRPLTGAHLRALLDHFDPGPACAGERTGHWNAIAKLRVAADLAIQPSVQLRRVDGGEREPELEKCAQEALASAMRAHLAEANYTLDRALSAQRKWRVDVHTREEVAAALIDQRRVWHGEGSRTSTLAACVAKAPDSSRGPDGSVRVPLKVTGEVGDVYVRWEEAQSLHQFPPLSAPPFFRCIADVLGYARLPEHGVRDYAIDVDVQKDGTLVLR